MKIMMIIFQVFAFTVAALTSLGQLHNVQNRRLQFDIADRQKHRHMILATYDFYIGEINKMPEARRSLAMRQLQAIIRQLQELYEDGKDDEVKNELKETYRRHRFNQYHLQNRDAKN